MSHLRQIEISKARAARNLAIDHVNRCRRDFRAAMSARDAIEECASPEWRAAHATARTAAVALDNAFEHAYAVGVERPHWAW
jgi:hypothetical protein